MKRLILLLTCFSILQAGALWALEGCLDFGSGHAWHYEDHSSALTHDETKSHANHSHTDSSRVHCPNFLDEFLISSPVIISSDNGRLHYDIRDALIAEGLLSDSILLAKRDGPPGVVHFKILSRHLLLSVIRI